MGEMLKQGHVRKNWKRRFFALNISDRAVCYYVDKSMAKKKGEFSVAYATIDPVEVSSKRASDSDNALRVTTAKGGKKFVLECSNTAERDEWVRILRETAKGDTRESFAPPTSGDSSVLSQQANGVVFIDAFLAEETQGQVPNVRVKSASFANTAEMSAALAAEADANLPNERIAKTGFLAKKGQVNHQWKERWFSLSDAPETKSIQYFKTAGGIDFKGEIPLDARHTLVKEHSTKERLHCFCVSTVKPDSGTTKTVFLSCETKEDVDEWMDAIRRALTTSALEERQKVVSV